MRLNKKLLFATLLTTLLGAACTPGRLSTPTDGGVWFSQDKGAHWVQRSVVYQDRLNTRTISDMNIRKLIFSSIDDRKLFAITEKSGLWMSWNAGNNWDQILGSTNIQDIVVHPTDPRTIYAAVDNAVVKSVDEGETWKAVHTSDDVRNAITTILLLPRNPNVVYATAQSGDILLSENAGVSWRIFSHIDGEVQKMQFHPSNDKIIYAGVHKKGLFISYDEGGHWESFDEKFKNYPNSNDFRDFELIPSGIIYASSYGLLRSLNQGKDWTSLPLISTTRDSNIYSLAVNPNNPLEIYYGTKSTFYRSVDGGFNWIPIAQPTTRATSDILINHTNTDDIYLGVQRSR